MYRTTKIMRVQICIGANSPFSNSMRGAILPSLVKRHLMKPAICWRTQSRDAIGASETPHRIDRNEPDKRIDWAYGGLFFPERMLGTAGRGRAGDPCCAHKRTCRRLREGFDLQKGNFQPETGHFPVAPLARGGPA